MNSKKIRVLQVNKLYYPWIGGIETVVKDIAEGLKDKVDMKVLVCQPKGKTKFESINGVSIIKAGSFGRLFSLPVSFSFFRLFFKFSKNSDIIHLHLPFPLADLASFLSKYRGKLIVWWHSDIVKQKIFLPIYKPLMNWLLNRADLIIVATTGHITGSKYLAPFKHKCKVIPFGLYVDKYKFTVNKQLLSNHLHFKQYKKILFVGRLVYYKGINILIEAFRYLSNCELFIVGEGPLLKELTCFVNKFNLSKIIHFLGKLNDEDLKQAFLDCDIFVLPSVANSEAFGLVQLEAMLCEKPVINTSLPTGVPYVSLHNVSGLTVSPGNPKKLADAIKKLVDDDQLRLFLGKNAKNRVTQIFNINNTLEKLYLEYENLLEL